MEKLKYMTKVMRITQNYNGSYSHYGNSHGNPKDYPVDEACENTGRSSFYAPCRCKVVRIYGVGNRGTNTIWLQSTSRVQLANGRKEYVTIMCIHSNDSSLRNIRVGQIFEQGEYMFREGSDGLSSGNHIHISVGIGGLVGTGWKANSKGQWVIKTSGGAIKPEDAFFIDTDFTRIVSSGGIDFKKVQEDLDYDAVARKVINGDYGNMPGRKKKLEAEGYDYETVRRKVNAFYD